MTPKLDDLAFPDHAWLLIGEIAERERRAEVRAERNCSWRHLEPEIDRSRRIALVMGNHQIAELGGIDDGLNTVAYAAERSAQAGLDNHRLVGGDHEEIDCRPRKQQPGRNDVRFIPKCYSINPACDLRCSNHPVLLCSSWLPDVLRLSGLGDHVGS